MPVHVLDHHFDDPVAVADARKVVVEIADFDQALQRIVEEWSRFGSQSHVEGGAGESVANLR